MLTPIGQSKELALTHVVRGWRSRKKRWCQGVELWHRPPDVVSLTLKYLYGLSTAANPLVSPNRTFSPTSLSGPREVQGEPSPHKSSSVPCPGPCSFSWSALRTCCGFTAPSFLSLLQDCVVLLHVGADVGVSLSSSLCGHLHGTYQHGLLTKLLGQCSLDIRACFEFPCEIQIHWRRIEHSLWAYGTEGGKQRPWWSGVELLVSIYMFMV